MPPKRASKKNTKLEITKPSKATASTSKKAEAGSSTSLAAEVASSENSPVFFWREYGSEHAYLSQWYKSPFTTDSDKSIVFQDAEQYMMYQKAVLFSDPATGALILQETSPKEIKALGRLVQNFDDKIWLANRERIVEEGSYFKFKNGKPAGEDMEGKVGEEGGLKARLLGTGKRELVEASPRDRIWGVGFGAKNAEKMREKWGLNLLGKALMKVREQLKDEEGTAEKEEL